MDANQTLAIWFAAARAVQFGSCLLLLAVWTFDRIVITAVGEPYRSAIARSWQRIVRWLILLALPAVLVSGLGWLALVAIQMTGLPPSQALRRHILGLVLSHTRFGADWQWRGAFWLACAVVAIFILPLRRLSVWRSVLVWIAVIFASLLLGSLAWAGHGQTGESPRWHLLSDVSHLVVAGLWPGGLLPLVLILLCLHGTATDGLQAMSAIVNRFSTMSLSCVAILLASGVVNSCYMLQSVWDLADSNYGRVLLLKIILFLLMGVLASLNRFYLKPRLSMVDAADGSGRTTVARLRISVGSELTLGIFVILVVAWLGMLPPPGG